MDGNGRAPAVVQLSAPEMLMSMPMTMPMPMRMRRQLDCLGGEWPDEASSAQVVRLGGFDC